jgi:hypothetical protein
MFNMGMLKMAWFWQKHALNMPTDDSSLEKERKINCFKTKC